MKLFTLLFGLVPSLLPLVVRAQDFSVPSTWRSPSNSRSRSERVNLAQAAADEFKNKGILATSDADYYTAPHLLSTLARKDLIAGTKDNLEFVTQSIINYDSMRKQVSPNGEVLYIDLLFGITLVDAYRAYGNNSMLDRADEIWSLGLKSQIQVQDATNGNISSKSSRFQSECNGHSVAGGVFGSSSRDTMMIMSYSTLGFMMLSAYLAEIFVRPSDYRDAAVLSAQFMTSTFTAEDGFFYFDATLFSSNPCKVNDIGRYGNTTGTIGMFVEGASVLADVTGDSTWRTTMSKMLATTAHSALWTSSDGIIKTFDESNSQALKDAGEDISEKGFWIGNLYEPWARNLNDKALTTFVESYVNVQANAILDLAKATNANYYSPSWHGPAATDYTLGGQHGAIAALAAAIGPSSSSSSKPPAGSGSRNNDFKNNNNVGKIVGIAVGVAVPVLLLIGLAIWFILRKRKRAKQHYLLGGADSEKSNPSNIIIEPFIQPTIPFQDPPSTVNDSITSHTSISSAQNPVVSSTIAGERTGGTVLTWGEQQPASSVDGLLPASAQPVSRGISMHKSPPPASIPSASTMPSSSGANSAAIDAPRVASLSRTSSMRKDPDGPTTVTNANESEHNTENERITAAPLSILPENLPTHELRRRLEDVPTPEMLRILQERMRLENNADEVLPSYTPAPR